MSKSAVWKCPSCGRSLKVIPLARGGAGESMTTIPLDLPGNKGFSEEMVIEEPTGKSQTVEGDVKVPLFKAAIYGLVASLVALTMALIWGWPLWGWPEWVPALAGVGGFALFWLILESDARTLLRRRIAPVEVEAEIVTVEIKAEERPEQTVYAHFKAPPERVRRFCIDMLNGKTGVYESSLTRRKFEPLRAEAVARGLLAWKDPDNHNLGCELTRAGEHVFKRILAD